MPMTSNFERFTNYTILILLFAGITSWFPQKQDEKRAYRCRGRGSFGQTRQIWSERGTCRQNQTRRAGESQQTCEYYLPKCILLMVILYLVHPPASPVGVWDGRIVSILKAVGALHFPSYRETFRIKLPIKPSWWNIAEKMTRKWWTLYQWLPVYFLVCAIIFRMRVNAWW